MCAETAQTLIDVSSSDAGKAVGYSLHVQRQPTVRPSYVPAHAFDPSLFPPASETLKFQLALRDGTKVHRESWTDVLQSPVDTLRAAVVCIKHRTRPFALGSDMVNGNRAYSAFVLFRVMSFVCTQLMVCPFADGW